MKDKKIQTVKTMSASRRQRYRDGSDDEDGQGKPMSRKHCNALLIDSGEMIQSVTRDLALARATAARAGLTVDSPIILKEASGEGTDPSKLRVPLTTGGHSNTDHIVIRTGDKKKDRISELKRNMLRRYRAMQPESKGDNKWDKPRAFGERRRRIVREKDGPEAPPEAPPSGYVVFVGQMTLKLRHNRPKVRHDQTKIVQEISKMWRLGMSDTDRQYYSDFSDQIKREYSKQNIEFRATGSYKPSENFEQLAGTNVWVRSLFEDKNKLEREINTYASYEFPKRPPQFDEEYEQKLKASAKKRKMKLKGLLNNDGTVRDDVDVEAALLQRKKRRKRAKGNNSRRTTL